jgi:hypothetical protein
MRWLDTRIVESAHELVIAGGTGTVIRIPPIELKVIPPVNVTGISNLLFYKISV